MINSIVDLFNAFFTACLKFDNVILFMGAVGLASVITTVFVYILKGKY